MSEEIHPRLEDMISEWEDEMGLSKSQIVGALERQYGLDLTEVDDADAKKFVDAYEAGDVDTAGDVLKEYGVADDDVEAFKQQVRAMEDTGSDPQGNGDSPSSATESSQSSGEGLTPQQRQEIQQMIPDASDIASQIRSQMGGGGGSGGSDGQQGQQNNMAQLISLAELFGGNSGGGQMAELGQKTMNAAMQAWINDMKKPSLGDMIEYRLYENMADDAADQFQKQMFGGDPFDGLEDLGGESDDSDDSDDDSGFSFI